MKLVATLALILGLLGLGARPAAALPLFDQTRTGAQLFSDADVIFPTETPTVSGSALDIINSADAQVLLRWSLLPAAPRGALLVTVAVDYERITTQTTDNDPLIGIAGNDLFLGASRQNNAGGRVRSVRSTVSGPDLSGTSGGAVFLGSIDPLGPFEFDLRTDLPAIVRYEEGSDTATGAFAPSGASFDATGPIDFVWGTGGASEGEGYRINSVSVTIATLPEPGAAALLALAFAVGPLALRRR